MGTLGTPYLAGLGASPYLVLCIAMFLVGSANGLVEIGINPLAATLYPTEKTHMLNILHAWWPGGLMLGGLLALVDLVAAGSRGGRCGQDAGGDDVRLAGEDGIDPGPHADLWGLVPLRTIPGHGASRLGGVHRGRCCNEALRPMFLLWAFCMMLTASTELAPQGMQSLVLEKTAGMNGTYILIYTSLMMFVLRHFAGPIAHRLSPVGMLTGSAVLSAIGLYALSFAYDFTTAIAAATIFGLGIVYFWPTMLGVTAERFPRGGAFLLGLMGFVGNLAIGLVQPWMGRINDEITFAAIPAEHTESDRGPGGDRSGQAQELAARCNKRSSRRPRRKGRSGRSATSRFCP